MVMRAMGRDCSTGARGPERPRILAVVAGLVQIHPVRPFPKKLVLGSAVALLAAVMIFTLPGLYTEARWFGQLGQGAVFWRGLSASWTTGLVVALLAGGLILLSVEAAIRRAGRIGLSALGPLWTPARWTARALSGVAGLLMGVAASEGWLKLKLFLAAEPVGRVDPIFGRDLGFYLLDLPALHMMRSLLVGALVVAAVGAGIVYLTVGKGRLDGTLGTLALRHGAVVGAGLFVLSAAGHLLDRWDLLFDGAGVAAGAGYTDLHARAPAYLLCAAAAVLASVACLASAWTARRRAAVLGIAVYALTVVVGSWIAPFMMQRFGVQPNELAREKPYIRLALAGTREAYGLSDVATRTLDFGAAPSALAIADARPTLDNVRLWDSQPLLATYGQLQLIRSYYDFHDVDIDRYWLEDGELRQVMLSIRELDEAKLPESARTWVNVHLKYTHGYGLVASPVNRVTPEGLPELWVQDIPPRATVAALEVTQPAIYFGERTDEYALVGTSTPEFDYPAGDANQPTHYRGRGGVPLGGVLSRLAWSMRLGSSEVLLSSYVRPSTRVLFRRNIRERVTALAPFLQYDRDPYPAVVGGRLHWIMDAYTTAETYPYSEAQQGGFNYIRNSVKAVVDAIDGTVTFYVNDPDDPILAAYRRVFPGLFTPLGRMPEELRRHLRYPTDLFSVQVDKYVAYHMDDPEVFYNKEDLWQVPQTAAGAEQQRMEPYYVTMQLPDGDRPEFLLMLPLTPRNRDNMIALLAARNDGEHRGELVEYVLPKDRLIYGPNQIEARIDQDPQVSQQLTLWDQRGSQVLRGTLLVIPVGDGFLYVQPVYLQAERGRIPELKRVIVAAGDRIAMRETLEEAVRAVLAPSEASPALALATADQPPPAPAGVPPPPGARPAEGAPAPPAPEAGAAAPASPPTALDHLEAARAKLAAGDWEGYGAEMAALERLLRQTAQ
jgi:uncharacterized membrane protein (UPF0182 family)